MSRAENRLQLEFGCGSLKLAGTLDQAPGTTGLLIVSGGNELRSGAFSGQSQLAAKLARKGFPVFRFDRHGVGDSEGENRGFTASAKDIHAALEAFKALAPQVDRVFGFGNCDAASALMLAGGDKFDGLILSNPWTLDESEPTATDEPTHTASAIRSRYWEKLKNPREVWRLLSGGVNMAKLAKGIASSTRSAPAPSDLVGKMRDSIASYDKPVRFLLAQNDRTAQLFKEAWPLDTWDSVICEGAGHSYVELDHRAWLEAQILECLRA